MLPRCLLFVVLMALWVILSGHLDALHLGLGVVACLLVVWMSGDLFAWKSEKPAARVFREGAFFVPYALWILKELVISNLHVLRLALSPNGMQEVEPRIVRYKTFLKSDLARFIFANSITLTPGTVTIRMEGDELYVHAISRATAESVGGEMERKIGRIFGELPES